MTWLQLFQKKLSYQETSCCTYFLQFSWKTNFRCASSHTHNISKDYEMNLIVAMYMYTTHQTYNNICILVRHKGKTNLCFSKESKANKFHQLHESCPWFVYNNFLLRRRFYYDLITKEWNRWSTYHRTLRNFSAIVWFPFFVLPACVAVHLSWEDFLHGCSTL